MQGEAELQNKGTRNDDLRSGVLNLALLSMAVCCRLERILLLSIAILKSLFVCSIFSSSAYPAPTTVYCEGFAESYFRSGAQD